MNQQPTASSRPTTPPSARSAHRSSTENRPTAVNGHLFLPIRGHRFSPLVAMISPHWRPSNLPTIGAVGGIRSGA